MNLRVEVEKLKAAGYSELNAIARLCQDVVLEAIRICDLTHNVTVKGGVVMRNLSKNARRATQDLDLDFIRYPLTDEAICSFIQRLNCIDGLTLAITGAIDELNHQDYKGRRVHLLLRDAEGVEFVSKLDIGVHREMSAVQEEFCFDICFKDDGASLLMNSPEQVLVEKLKSLLRFGVGCTRYKDVYDICYLIDLVKATELKGLLGKYIFSYATLAVNSSSEIHARIQKVYANSRFVQRLASSGKNWLGITDAKVLAKTLNFLLSLSSL